ncbi:hypothetical protein E2C01_061462 [Portunus trituberculatus]|uniref:Uncharacterized protein n=1 Tax=Portunus trituberculatus TaxID=210409 RepID=A0A5B7HBQ3_PORTR|nr:hypothetical protein [Portunus trituberculatus]
MSDLEDTDDSEQNIDSEESEESTSGEDDKDEFMRVVATGHCPTDIICVTKNILLDSGSTMEKLMKNGGRCGTVEPCLLWGPQGLQAHEFESCPRSEYRLGFLTWGNGFLVGGL